MARAKRKAEPKAKPKAKATAKAKPKAKPKATKAKAKPKAKAPAKPKAAAPKAAAEPKQKPRPQAKGKPQGSTLRVTLTKSPAGRLKRHKACVVGLGLRRIGQTVQVQDTPAVRGMINRVKYMVRVEEET